MNGGENRQSSMVRSLEAETCDPPLVVGVALAEFSSPPAPNWINTCKNKTYLQFKQRDWSVESVLFVVMRWRVEKVEESHLVIWFQLVFDQFPVLIVVVDSVHSSLIDVQQQPISAAPGHLQGNYTDKNSTSLETKDRKTNECHAKMKPICLYWPR